MSSQLKMRGHKVGRRKARRYMTEMGINPIYPKMNLSKRMQQAKVLPVSASQCRYRPSKSGMVNRHHLYPHQAWIPVSDSCNRLVQPLYCRLGS